MKVSKLEISMSRYGIGRLQLTSTLTAAPMPWKPKYFSIQSHNKDARQSEGCRCSSSLLLSAKRQIIFDSRVRCPKYSERCRLLANFEEDCYIANIRH